MMNILGEMHSTHGGFGEAASLVSDDVGAKAALRNISTDYLHLFHESQQTACRCEDKTPLFTFLLSHLHLPTVS